jgi:hypothetical protein
MIGKANNFFGVLVIGMLLAFLSVAQSQEVTLGINDTGEDFRESVHTVRIEAAQIQLLNGKYIEGARNFLREVTYSVKGNKQSEFIFGIDGKLLAKRAFHYDAKGDLSEVIEYYPDGSLRSKTVYMPDSTGTSVEEIVYSNNKASASKTVYKYENGRQVEMISLNGDGNPSINTYISYNDRGKIREIIICANNSQGGMILSSSGGEAIVLTEPVKEKMKGLSPCVDGFLTSRTVFAYDDKDDLSETSSYTHDNSLISKETYYKEYDSRGNWVKEVKSKWNFKSGKIEPVEATYRTITYY